MDNWITMHNLKILRGQQSKIHLKEKDKIYKCETCDKEFKNNNGLKKHFNTVHEGLKNYKCYFCESFFGTPHRLKCHMKRVHEEEKN